MKRNILIIIMLLIPSAFAFMAGDPIEFSIMNCNKWAVVEVNALNPMSNMTNISEEYWFEDCDPLEEENLWMCYCESSVKKVVMHTSSKTLNTYELKISYEYQTPQEIQTGGSGGGGRSYIYVATPNNVTTPEYKECPDCEDYNYDLEPEPQPEPEPVPPPEKDINESEIPKTVRQSPPTFTTGLVIIGLIIFAGLFAYFYYLYEKYNGGTQQ